MPFTVQFSTSRGRFAFERPSRCIPANRMRCCAVMVGVVPAGRGEVNATWNPAEVKRSEIRKMVLGNCFEVQLIAERQATFRAAEIKLS